MNPTEWLSRQLRLDGPKEIAEITITQYEDGKLGYQFTGLNGRPMNPIEVHQILTAVRREVERVVQPIPAEGESPVDDPAIDPSPTLQLEGVPV